MNIAEIAKMAGVSSSAVSRYLNNGYVSEEKKAAIASVIEKTGYRPSVQAQMLRTKKSKLIGVILPKINSASLGRVVAGILSVLDQNGYKMLLADTQNSPEKELEYLSVFNEKQVDGVLFIATVFTDKHKKLLKKLTIPVVLIGQYLQGMNCVYHDDYHAAYDITTHMLHRGRTNIGMISAILEDKEAGAERYRGFCDALKEKGLEEQTKNYVVSDFTMQGGYEAAEKLLQKSTDLDAIVCATDTIATGVMRYLKEHNIEIPKKIMISGFGDSELSKVTSPTLTTVHFSFKESGQLAAEMIMECMKEKKSQIKAVMMGYHMVENESTRA